MAVIKKDGNSMGIPMNINRGNPIPLDATSVWYSYEEAKEYAKSSPTAYVGQIITVVGAQSSTAYIISNLEGDLLALSLATGSLQGKLTIGSHVYDGTEDVNVNIYDGEEINN